MRRGRTRWTVKVPAALLDRIRNAARNGQKSARQIFDELELSRYVRFDPTFRRWVSDERKTYAARLAGGPDLNTQSDGSPSSSGPQPPSPAELEAALMVKAMEQVEAGNLKASTIVGLLMANASVKKERIRDEANRRAEEKHAAWKIEHQKKQEQALVNAAPKAGLTPEQIQAIREQVLGL